MEGKWLSVLEYASFKKKSISTVRRYIKAKRVKFREENGKYFIWTKNFINNENQSQKDSLELKLENQRLLKENRILREELAELSMLVNIYETQKNKTPDLPVLPSGL